MDNKLTYNGNNIISLTNNFIERSVENNNRLANFDFNSNNVNNFINILSDDITEYINFHSVYSFLQYVSPDPIIRKNSHQSDVLLTKYINNLNSRRDVYDKLIECKKHINDKLVNFVIKGYERNGIGLNKNDREKLHKITNEIIYIEKKITDHVINNNKTISLTSSELAGLPETFIKNLGLVKNNNKIKYNICLNHNLYINCMRYIHSDKIRHKLETLYSEKCGVIMNDVAKLIVLRDLHAKLLGYENHSDYKNELQLSKSAENIHAFLVTIVNKMDYRYNREIDTLIKIKSDDEINSWDLQYLTRKWKKEYGINDNIVKEYFPLNHVMSEILKIYEELFNFTFVKNIQDNTVWHPDVLSYNVYSDNMLIGYFYLDLYSREGKYEQPRCFTLRPAAMFPLASNKYQYPISALVCCFNKGSLLHHFDVVQIFHEFSHVIHNLCAKNKYSLFSGTNVETDFIETPALMLEYLCWEKKILKKLSCHYKDSSCLPDDLIDKMVKIRDLDIGIHYKKHVLISVFDQFIHSSDKFIKLCNDIIHDSDSGPNVMLIFTNLYKHLHLEILKRINFNVFPGICLNYLCNDDGQYYSYIWSKIYAADLYNYINSNNLSLGKILRFSIYGMLGNKSPKEIMKSILKRDPDINEFFKLHNLDYDAEYSFFLDSEHQISESSVLYSNRFSEIDKSEYYKEIKSLNIKRNLVGKNNDIFIRT